VIDLYKRALACMLRSLTTRDSLTSRLEEFGAFTLFATGAGNPAVLVAWAKELAELQCGEVGKEESEAA
jgi:hypothetical protein